MGRPKGTIDDWLKDDPAKLEWAIDYFNDLKDEPDAPYLAAAISRGYPQALEALQRLQTTPDGERRVGKMRNAWSRQKSNRKLDKKPTSLSITHQASERLDRLTEQTGLTKSATLELLINRGFDFETEARKERREELAKERQELADKKRYPLRPNQTTREMALAHQINELIKRVDHLTSLLPQSAGSNALSGQTPETQPGLGEAAQTESEENSAAPHNLNEVSHEGSMDRASTEGSAPVGLSETSTADNAAPAHDASIEAQGPETAAVNEAEDSSRSTSNGARLVPKKPTAKKLPTAKVKQSQPASPGSRFSTANNAYRPKPSDKPK